MKNIRKTNEIVRESITIALIEKMKKKEIKDISVVELVEKAGVGRVSFYRNFSGKEDVIRQHLDAITDDFIYQTGIDYYKLDIKSYITLLFTHLYHHRELAEILIKSNILHLVKDEFDRIFLKKDIQNAGKYNLYFLAGGLYNIFYHWAMEGFN